MAHLHTADSFQVKIYKAMLIFRGFSICCIKGKYKLVAVLQKDTNLQKRRDRQMVQRAIKPMTIIATQKFVYKYFSNIIIIFQSDFCSTQITHSYNFVLSQFSIF